MSNAPSKPVSFSRPKVGYFSNRPRTHQLYSYVLDLVSTNSIEIYPSANVGTRRYTVYRKLNKSITRCRINAVRALVIFCVAHSALSFCRFEELQCSRQPLPYLCCLSGCDGFVDMTCLGDTLYSKAKRSLKPARLSPAAFNSRDRKSYLCKNSFSQEYDILSLKLEAS